MGIETPVVRYKNNRRKMRIPLDVQGHPANSVIPSVRGNTSIVLLTTDTPSTPVLIGGAISAITPPPAPIKANLIRVACTGGDILIRFGDSTATAPALASFANTNPQECIYVSKGIPVTIALREDDTYYSVVRLEAVNTYVYITELSSDSTIG